MTFKEIALFCEKDKTGQREILTKKKDELSKKRDELDRLINELRALLEGEPES